jgi:hypothetical protein
MFRNLSFLNFIDKLQNCFKIKINKLFNKLILEIFIAKNTKNKQKITKYLQKIIFYTQLTNIEEI